MAKRKFYNTGEAKGFTKEVFFQTVLAIMNGEQVDGSVAGLVAEAAEYELEGIAARKATAANKTGEKKDPMASEYAQALKAAITKYLSTTPQSAKQLLEKMNADGVVAPNGNAFAAPWTSRVLNAMDGVTQVVQVVEVTNAKGLKSQREINCYKKA